MDMLDRVFLHQIAEPGHPGHITAGEAAAIRGDQRRILERPVVERSTDLADIPDAPADGETLVWNAAEARWISGTAGGSIAVIRDHTGAVVAEDIGDLTARLGLTAVPIGSTRAGLQVNFAGTGTADTVARSNHVHIQYTDRPVPIPASGSLSSGTRPLGSLTITGLDPQITYYIGATLVLDLRGEGTGAGRSIPSITIGPSGQAVKRDRPSARTVAGVDREAAFVHEGIAIAGVTSVPVSCAIQFSSGDPVYVDAGRLTISIRGNR